MCSLRSLAIMRTTFWNPQVISIGNFTTADHLLAYLERIFETLDASSRRFVMRRMPDPPKIEGRVDFRRRGLPLRTGRIVTSSTRSTVQCRAGAYDRACWSSDRCLAKPRSSTRWSRFYDVVGGSVLVTIDGYDVM